MAYYNAISAQVQADYHLLKYNDYEDYLQSYADEYDICYIGDDDVINTMVRYGYK